MTGIPPSTLMTNLAALDRVQPQLARRLRWSVSSDHVVRRADGVVVLKAGAGHRPLAFPERELLAQVGTASAPPAVLALGVGLGESVEAALGVWPNARVTAWDRDPWMLRMLLSRRDFSRPLLTRRLHLLLGPDLLDIPADLPERVIEHPLLATVYDTELAAWRTSGKRAIALVCTHGLFVHDVCSVLGERGFVPWTVEVERVDSEEFQYTVAATEPVLAVAVNQVVGLPEALHAAEVPLVTWEIDPAVDWFPEPAHAVPRSHLFSFRRASAAALSGGEHGSVTWLPLAAPARRRPVEVSAAERERFSAPVSFVGSSMAARARPYAKKFQLELRTWLHQHDRPPAKAAGLTTAILTAQRATPDQWRVPELLEERCPGFRAWSRAADRGADPAVLIGELVAAEHRLQVVGALAPFGVHVWGDHGWNALKAAGVRVRGLAGHFHALTRIYQLSRINIDIGRLYQADIVTMRVFDVLACGGFLLAAHSDELAELLEPGVEVETWRTRAELVDKVRFYLAHPDAADALARRGHEAVLARHRVDQRVDRMLAVAGVPAPVDQSE